MTISEVGGGPGLSGATLRGGVTTVRKSAKEFIIEDIFVL